MFTAQAVTAEPRAVYLFPETGGFAVVIPNILRETFTDRATGFSRAKELARLHAPSRIVNGEPDEGSLPSTAEEVAVTLPSDVPQAQVAHGAQEGISDPSGDRSPASLAGPEALGRSLIVESPHEIPAPWRAADRLELIRDRLSDPALLEEIRHRHLARLRSIYIVPPDFVAPVPERMALDVFNVPVDHDFVAEAIYELVVANSVDCRDLSDPRFPAIDLALKLGAVMAPDGVADVLVDGASPAWCDGGPLQLFARTDLSLNGVPVIARASLERGSLRPLSADAPSADLAIDQLQAVAEPTSRARIIAPAGSGKTRVLTERARHLLGAGLPPSALLLVAFNKRAQGQMTDRTSDLAPLQIRTLNALALSIVNGDRGFAHREERVVTIDELEVRRLLGEMVSFPRRSNTDPAAAWIDALSAVRLGLRSPQDVESSYGGDVDGFAEHFSRYRSELRRRGVVDFDEQIYRALEILLTDPETRAAARQRAGSLLVDEFQDLTPAHMLLLRLLAGPELGIYAVGDDDQTIYGYSGASPRWLVDFDRFVPCAAAHALDVNYRCPPEVIGAATNLLSRNADRVVKVVHPGRHGADSPSLRVLVDPIPIEATIAAVRDLLTQGVRPDEIAVLSRVNTLLAPVQAGLRMQGIDVDNRDPNRFLSRSSVAAAVSWFNLSISAGHLAGPDIGLAARRPSRGIAPRVVEWMSEQSDRGGLERLAGRMSDPKAAAKIQSFVADLERIQELGQTASSWRIIEFIRFQLGLETSFRGIDNAHRGRNSTAHSDDLRALEALGRLHPDAPSFRSWLTEALTPDNSPGNHGRVTLATVHKVKGLEWPNVVIHDATFGVFPHRLSDDLEEERRIFHVALTRTQRTVTIVADQNAPSPFLDEIESRGEPRAALSELPGADVPTGAQGPTDLVAEQGLEVYHLGYEWILDTISDDGATALMGGVTTFIPFGTIVEVARSRRRIVAQGSRPKKRSAAAEAENPEVFAGLRAWRSERARADAVPAYVIAKDATLLAIAAALPRSPDDLLTISGIGPAKIERFGDEIIAVVDEARASL